jgi:poly(hydroxyalkanoate) granule-associated protein
MAKMLSSARPKEIMMVTLVRDIAHQLWLAGLGAAAKAQEKGGELLESLIEEGEKVEARAKGVTAIHTEPGNAILHPQNVENLEKIFQDRVERALKKLDVPTQADLQDLNQRMDALSQHIATLFASAKDPNNRE